MLTERTPREFPCEELPSRGLLRGHLCLEEVLVEGTEISYDVFQVSFLSSTIFTDKSIFLKYSYSWLCEKKINK